MAKPKKAKRNGRLDSGRIVAYIRIKPEEHEQITQIVKDRGYPHTFASVASEILSEGLASRNKAA